MFRNQFDAQYGAALAAVVTVATKSGTNNLHGTGYYFGRDDSMNARNAFQRSKPVYGQKRIGGSVGGPILRNRTHFFGAYEYTDVDKREHHRAAGEQPVRGRRERRVPGHLARAPAREQGRPPAERPQLVLRALRLRRPVRHAHRPRDGRFGQRQRLEQDAQRHRRAELGALELHGEHASARTTCGTRWPPCRSRSASPRWCGRRSRPARTGPRRSSSRARACRSSRPSTRRPAATT